MDVYSKLLGINDGVDPQITICISAPNIRLIVASSNAHFWGQQIRFLSTS